MKHKIMLDQIFSRTFIKDASLLDLVCLNTLLGKMHPANKPNGMVDSIRKEVQDRYKITHDAKRLQRYIGK